MSQSSAKPARATIGRPSIKVISIAPATPVLRGLPSKKFRPILSKRYSVTRTDNEPTRKAN
jgi:hypothetical protein